MNAFYKYLLWVRTWARGSRVFKTDRESIKVEVVVCCGVHIIFTLHSPSIFCPVRCLLFSSLPFVGTGCAWMTLNERKTCYDSRALPCLSGFRWSGLSLDSLWSIGPSIKASIHHDNKYLLAGRIIDLNIVRQPQHGLLRQVSCLKVKVGPAPGITTFDFSLTSARSVLAFEFWVLCSASHLVSRINIQIN